MGKEKGGRKGKGDRKKKEKRKKRKIPRGYGFGGVCGQMVKAPDF